MSSRGIPPAGLDSDIDLRTWRQFLAVADVLHFGRAARQLSMTQPPLTQAVQKLEARLGLPLFERTRRSVALTPAGAALIEPVRQLLRAAGALPHIAKDAAAGEVGIVRLGFVSTVAFGPLPKWLRGFREAHPGVTMRLKEATGDVQMAAFAQGELDAGFVLHSPEMAPTSRVPLERLSVGVEPFVLALPAGQRSKVRERTTAELLAGPLVIFPRETAPSLYDAVLAFFHRRGIAPTIAQEAIQMQTIVNLVSAGLGLALVPQVVAKLRRPGIEYRPFPRALARRAPSCETSLVWTSDASPAVLRFVEHVRRTKFELRE